ncbi:MAG: hypothetical protein HY658_00010 [Actinobacteria bacterium]|nr:hypothetical protein [Actinomycetota bacterium]
MSAATCPTCGAPRVPGAAFCGRCGTRFDQVSASTQAVAAAQPVREITVDWKDLARRAKDIWFPLILVGVMGYIDYLAHGQIFFVVIAGVGSILLILFRKEIGARMGLGRVFGQFPPWVRPVLTAIPALLWFVIRGQGTSGAGLLVMLTTLAMVGGLAILGPQLDGRLRGFYQRRNRVIPRRLRMLLAVLVPILLGFWIVHGTLAALPVLFQGTTSSPAYATDRGGLFVLSTLISGGVAFLLLREAKGDAR